jgi:hypothetical protein
MIAINKQISYQSKKLRQGKRDRSILQSLEQWQLHFGEKQSNTCIVVGMTPTQYRQFISYLETTGSNV